MEDIKKLSLEQLSEVVVGYKEKKFRAKQIYEWIWKKNVNSYDEMTNIPKLLKDRLAKRYNFNSIKIDSFKKSKDQTIKYVFKLHELSSDVDELKNNKKTEKNLFVEGVLIPSKSRVTACISTQVGCALKCKFCATGSMGFLRNLSAGEIYEQVALLNKESLSYFDRKLTNVVVMGMGEPLNNYKNTIDALDKVMSKNGLSMSPSRITLSTAGVSDKIKQLADDNTKFNLAVSLHSANDTVRNSLMPINKSNPLKRLTSALKYYNKKTGNRIIFEYLMLDGINDNINDAHELAEFCKSFPVKINLIEYNSTKNGNFKKSNRDSLGRFVNLLKSKNIIINIRKSKGSDIDAACGQLVNEAIKTNN